MTSTMSNTGVLATNTPNADTEAAPARCPDTEAPDSTAVLTVSELHKNFVLHNVDGRTVKGLQGVSLSVGIGEHVALAGTSGAGKSSLLKCIYRTYVPTSGSVLLHTSWGGNIELTALQDHELAAVRGRELAYVSQFLRPQPRRSPLEIVSKAAVFRGMDPVEAKEVAATALRRVNIDESLWDVYASVLSGGEKQRVNLAAGTVSPPRLLLLDEPVSALDPKNREAALELISELTNKGVAVLAVFHDLDAMERLATRVVLMEDGQVRQDGTPQAVLPTLAGVAR